MEAIWQTGIPLILAYLLGSIPSAYLVARRVTGEDIRHLGDGNMGAKNTFLSVGRGAGAIVALADIGKGALSVGLAQWLTSSPTIVLLAGACAVLGHDFPVFLGFRGGQGMATLIGTFLVLTPFSMLLGLGALGITLFLTHHWELSCAAAFITLVLSLLLLGQPTRYLVYALLLLPTLGLRKLMQIRQARRATVSSSPANLG